MTLLYVIYFVTEYLLKEFFINSKLELPELPKISSSQQYKAQG